MPRKPREFEKGEFYHIVARRIEEQPLFIDKDDYYRGIFSLYEFNDEKPVLMKERRKTRQYFKKLLQEIEIKEKLISKDKRDLLVEMVAFCLMPTHIHLLLKEIKEGGISKFMQKFGSGFAGYFKAKYKVKRRGHFFQDRFMAVPIKTEQQLKTVFVYIHTNPLSLIYPKWKEEGISNPKKAIKFLKEYKWSSYQDYIGKKNFPSLTKRDFLLEILEKEEGCKDLINSLIKEKKKLKEILKKYPHLALE